jgi:hypothetical protein
MKTIDIPETLYEKAQLRAVEQGTSWKAVVLASLERQLGVAPAMERPGSPWATRKLTPEYEALVNSGALKPKPGDRDITELISDDRDGR